MRAQLKVIAAAILFTAAGAAAQTASAANIPSTFSANQTWMQGGYTANWRTAASFSSANMFALTDSSTASAPARHMQPGHLFQVTTVPGSYLNPFAVYSQTAPNTGSSLPNASFEVTNGLDAGYGDAHLLFSNFSHDSTATYGNTTPHASQLKMQGLWSGPGFDLGPSGTAAQGWTAGHTFNPLMQVVTRGIHQMYSGSLYKYSVGDTALSYTYMTSFGGTVAAADEGAIHSGGHLFQMGWMSATIASGGATGSTLLTTASGTCHAASGLQDMCPGGTYFADGGILLDTQRAGITTAVSGYSYDMTLHGMYYTLSGTGVTPSTAWGNIVPASCTGNGNGQYGAYASTTCNVTLGSGAGSFNIASHIFLSGPFEEEAAITAAGAPVSGVQSITFSTRYAWDNSNGNTNGALVMQGGPGGQSFIATGSLSNWPIAYFIVGATSSTNLYFSNCRAGICNGLAGARGPLPLPGYDSFSRGGSLSRASNVVTFNMDPTSAPYRIYSYPVGSQVVLSGWTPSDLNGTYTVTSNTMDEYNGKITWAQTGSDEMSSVTGTISQPLTSITLYPSAFIAESYPAFKLGTNHVPFANGDAIAGAPAAEDQQKGSVMYQGQATPNDGGIASQGYTMVDEGPSPMNFQFSAVTRGITSPEPYMFYVNGSFGDIFHLYFRPAHNGTLLHVGRRDPSLLNIPYSIFRDDDGGQLTYYPANYSAPDTQGGFLFSGDIATKAKLKPQQSTPASSAATCKAGEMWTDANYIYVCVAANTIKRAALSSF